MTTAQTPPGSQQPGSEPPPPAEPEKHRRGPWLWVSLVLGVAVVALGAWGVSKNADLNDANQKIEDQAKAGSEAVTTAKGAFEDVNQDVAEANAEVADANAQAAQAQKEAEAARQKAGDVADQAAGEADQLRSQADAAQAEAKAAQSKAAAATDCAKAYVSAIGSLFEGKGDMKAKATAAREQLTAITADCKASFGRE